MRGTSHHDPDWYQRQKRKVAKAQANKKLAARRKADRADLKAAKLVATVGAAAAAARAIAPTASDAPTIAAVATTLGVTPTDDAAAITPAKGKNVGGRPAGKVKCPKCRRKGRDCGQLCANWPGPGPLASASASPSVVQQADAIAADIIATVATAAVPTRRVSARGNVHQKAYPEGPDLRDRATGKRHHVGGGVDGVVEEVEEEEEEEVEGGEETAKGARALLQLGGARRRAPPPLPPQEGVPSALVGVLLMHEGGQLEEEKPSCPTADGSCSVRSCRVKHV